MSKHRFDHTVDHSDESKPDRPPERLQRIEVITGIERRRKWSTKEKLEIVAESYVEGAVICEVARRHGISPQQLFGWRARVRAEMATMTQDVPPPFVPAIVDDTPARKAARPLHDRKGAIAGADVVASIEIALGTAVVRVRGAVDPRALTAVLKALKVYS